MPPDFFTSFASMPNRCFSVAARPAARAWYPHIPQYSMTSSFMAQL